ncbi:cytochrome c peroxidase [Pseudarcicella hirudinis]|uniref:Cytochrome c peroxidase n=1 Tax=Pseudarcicella hirudinis TaxID=1079859 RepID=A0A1I5VDC3_9BACT|nr:cytochrome c peroxidase [Pseudarcicella hirudinis]SFQ04986.1 cytochrome c peroxidase [Pseudarcicella hirudinis]
MKKLICISIALLTIACSKTEQAKPESLFSIPANFPQPVYDLKKNPISSDGFELGKALFYDGILSKDGTISCAECHSQPYGFTHHGHDLSHGINNLKGVRNSLPLQNLAWESEFFWDGGVGDLDFVPIAPIENPVEMDESTGNVLEKLRKTQRYPPMFKKAFGSEEITGAKFLQALSQFMITLVSANSRYDQYIRNEGEVLTKEELEGMALFRQKCSSCHAGELFTDKSYRNNGLTIQGSMDVGRYRITENDKDKYKFRVPGLRNVAVTLPYMHDGRFYTLEAVLEHYAEGVQNTVNLDPLLNQNGKRGIQLSKEEQSRIIAFLKTLTDETFLKDKRFINQ